MLEPRSRTQKKTVNTRKARPKWAKDEISLLAKVKTLRQWHIARMYWLENLTARNIADKLKSPVESIKQTIYRLRVTK